MFWKEQWPGLGVLETKDGNLNKTLYCFHTCKMRSLDNIEGLSSITLNIAQPKHTASGTKLCKSVKDIYNMNKYTYVKVLMISLYFYLQILIFNGVSSLTHLPCLSWYCQSHPNSKTPKTSLLSKVIFNSELSWWQANFWRALHSNTTFRRIS